MLEPSDSARAVVQMLADHRRQIKEASDFGAFLDDLFTKKPASFDEFLDDLFAEKEAGIPWKPVMQGISQLANHGVKGVGKGVKAVGKWAWPTAKMPKNPAKATRDLLFQESKPPKYNGSGTMTSGIFSGISPPLGRWGTAAGMRGLGGYYLGDSYDGDYFNEGGPTVPILGRLSNTGLRTGLGAAMIPAAAGGLAKGLGKFFTPAGGRILSDPDVLGNIISQPIMRAAGATALGDYLESADSVFEFSPFPKGTLKKIFTGLGALSGSRPGLMALGGKFPRVAENLYAIQPKGLPKFLNNSGMLTGANYGKANFVGFGLPTLLGHAVVAPQVKHWSDGLQEIKNQYERPEVQALGKEYLGDVSQLQQKGTEAYSAGKHWWDWWSPPQKQTPSLGQPVEQTPSIGTSSGMPTVPELTRWSYNTAYDLFTPENIRNAVETALAKEREWNELKTKAVQTGSQGVDTAVQMSVDAEQYRQYIEWLKTQERPASQQPSQ